MFSLQTNKNSTKRNTLNFSSILFYIGMNKMKGYFLYHYYFLKFINIAEKDFFFFGTNA